MSEPLYLICLDDYHLGDPLFLDNLAQQMGRSAQRPHCLFVHAGGERAERALEARGYFPERRDGIIIPSTPEEAMLIERAIREMNQKIVGALTDAVVPAVGFQGGDRGMLRCGEDGMLQTGRLGWLRALIEQRVVPVVSTLVQPTTGEGWAAASLSAVMPGLAANLPEAMGVFFVKGRLPESIEPVNPASTDALDELAPAVLPASEMARAVLLAGRETLLTTVSGLFGSEKPVGTRIIPTKTP